jgi:hypothetical protein
MFIYMAQNTSNGYDLSLEHQTVEIIGPTSCQPLAVPCPCRHCGLKLRPRHGTIPGPCRAWTMLFSVVPGLIVLVPDKNQYMFVYVLTKLMCRPL